jgi:hypothetical protein
MAARIRVNRAPVLTLWAAVVAERLGFDADEALTLGRVVAGLDAQAKGRSLGIFHPRPKALAEERKAMAHGAERHVDLLHRAVPVVRTPEGLRAVSKGKPVDPASVERYLASKLGDAYADARSAMQALAKSRAPDALAEEAYALYEAFRPAVPAGTRGWGAAGDLDLARIRGLARTGAGRAPSGGRNGR